MFTVVWAYLRNEHFTKDGVNYETAADLTGQANHLAATIEADLVKQKQPTNNGGFKVLNFGKTHPDMYQKLISDHPIDWTRYQVANCYMGRVPLINSGGASGKNDLQQAVRTAVINKRAGGTGLITGRKAFQKPMNEGRGTPPRRAGRVSGQRHHGGVSRKDAGLPRRDGGTFAA